MYLFYAHGGGLGHLTRIDKLIRNLKIPINKVIIITPSVFTKYFTTYLFIKISWNDTISNWCETVKKTINSYDIETFYVDTFPFGIKGELNEIYYKFPDLKYIYVSRLLKWQYYTQNNTFRIQVKFSKTILLETLYPQHLNWVKNNSEQIKHLQLKDIDITPIALVDKPYILVVHSGGKESVLEICNRAIKDNKHKITIAVFTQVNIKTNDSKIIIHRDVYPVSMYFHYAEKIYTAAGFNSIQELKNYRSKHIAIPINKLYDDQFFRYSKHFSKKNEF